MKIQSSLTASDYISILTILTSSVIAFVVARIQIRSTEKQLNKQLRAEVEKVKYQYELEQRRDDINFLNKFKLEKLVDLHEMMARKARYDTQLGNLFRDLIFRDNELIIDEEKESGIFQEDLNEYIKQRDNLEKKEFEESLRREISIHMSYFPKLKKEWISLHSLSLKVISYYPSQMLGLIEVRNPDFSHHKLPLDYTYGDYFKEVDQVNKEYAFVLDTIEKKIESIMIGLETNIKI